MLLPDEGDALELAERVALRLRISLLVLLSQHKVEDELLAPQDDALHHV